MKSHKNEYKTFGHMARENYAIDYKIGIVLRCPEIMTKWSHRDVGFDLV